MNFRIIALSANTPPVQLLMMTRFGLLLKHPELEGTDLDLETKKYFKNFKKPVWVPWCSGSAHLPVTQEVRGRHP
jgi:hypothetical protein